MCIRDSNNDALKVLVEKYEVELRQFPSEVLSALRGHAEAVIAEVAETDAFARQVYDSYQAFYARVRDWTAISEQAYLDTRVV